MSDELLPYYNRELAFIRKMGAEFAAAHPKIAGRLRLDQDSAKDPHVDRMIEAFAYLNARTRHKLEDEFPEVSESLLSVLYPHYLAPIPSCSIVQFALDRQQGELSSGYHIRRGSSVETDPIDGQPCRFRTAYDATLWPIKLTAADFRGRPFTAPRTAFAEDAHGVVRLQLECFSEKMTFHKLKLNTLRFFLKGQSQFIYNVYELLMNDVVGVALANPGTDTRPVVLPADCLRSVGFGADETLLDYPPQSFRGYALLSEYFALPEKYLFVDIQIPPDKLSTIQGKLDVFLYADRHSTDLEKNITAETFQLGCTPVVNLFPQRAEPIQLSHKDSEYRVIADARRPLAHEVYSIDRVVATSTSGKRAEYLPFYSVKHGRDAAQQRNYWHASRRAAGYAGGQVDRGTEVFLSLVDLDFRVSSTTNWTLDIETTCLNRDLPARLPFGGGQPRLQLTTGAPVSKVSCLLAPTPTRRPALRHGTLWRLISHLSLNHLSLADYENGADALREILTLYDYTGSAETRAMIDGITSVRSERVVGRVEGGISAGFCRGVEVTIQFDEQRFSGSGVFLFAAVLERFLGLYTSINSFTKTIATTKQREGVLRSWSPRAGEQVLV